MAAGVFKDIAVVVQCRLSSTRLPQKALKDLGGQECLCWTLRAMKKVKAAHYFLACDYDSASALEPLAKKCGWEIFAGERDDVLGRFCALVESKMPACDLIVRATGDNPFLFWEAAELSIEEFQKNYFDADYFTFAGLPHGSGVELFKAASILSANKAGASAYEREHVGPALYLHKEKYSCVFKKAPPEFFAPELRTTIDTFSDYKRAVRLQGFLRGQNAEPPFSCAQIMSALKNPALQKTVLFIPSAKAGRGTGHLRRALSLARETGAFVLLPNGSSLKETDSLLKDALGCGLKEFQIIREPLEKLGAGWDLLVLDNFRSSKKEIEAFEKIGPLCAIDEGGRFCAGADYLLDVIPSMPRARGLFNSAALNANCFNPTLISLPKNRRAAFPQKIRRALVCVSGETRLELSKKAAAALERLGVKVDEIDSKNPVANLRERLADYDLVLTHYGFTAFEALAANCAVLLVATSALHKRLSKRYGFACVGQGSLNAESLARLLENPAALENPRFKAALLGLANNSSSALLGLSNNSSSAPFAQESLASFVQKLSAAQKFSCPVCGAAANPGLAASSRFAGKVLARTFWHTFRRCPKCGMAYLAFSADSRVQYEEDYFGSEYKAQYGRSYLEDFDSIKAQGLRRAAEIRRLLGLANNSGSAPSGLANASCPRVLDIGCAYGPFLAAAKAAGFEPFGTDISKSALEYVQKTLGYKAVLSSFADFDPAALFGFEKFDAVTMWYVIEHCQDLNGLLRRANALLKEGGVLAFSTPSASGLSARFNRQKFFEQSPRDHYTLWQPGRAAKILRCFGFKTVKIVSTGVHPERVKFLKKFESKPFIFGLLSVFCKRLVLGDTFEIYCKKIKDAR